MAPQIRNCFFPPYSSLTFSLNLIKATSLVTSAEVDSDSKKIAKKVARFVLMAMFIPFFTFFSVFYNTMGLAIKGTCAVISSTNNASFFGYTAEEYLENINKHIACATRDIGTNFFIGFFCILYTFDPETTEICDHFLTNMVDYICSRQP
jgi:hypothetical protein